MTNKSRIEDEGQRTIWLNGEFKDANQALIPAESKGLFYGAGCFETMRASQCMLLHADRHILRLEQGINYLGTSLNSSFKEEFREIISNLLLKNQLHKTEAMVRIQVSLRGRRGYTELKKPDLNLLISCEKLDQNQSSVTLKSVESRVVPSMCRPPNLKLSNTIHYMDAWQSSIRKGADDAVMLTVDGYVAETAVANLFWKSGNTVYTPSAECDILPGIMRGIIIELFSFSELDAIEFCQGSYSPENLKSADEVWTTNSVREIMPVRKIDETAFPVNTLFFEKIMRLFADYKKRYLK